MLIAERVLAEGLWKRAHVNHTGKGEAPSVMDMARQIVAALDAAASPSPAQGSSGSEERR